MEGALVFTLLLLLTVAVQAGKVLVQSNNDDKAKNEGNAKSDSRQLKDKQKEPGKSNYMGPSCGTSENETKSVLNMLPFCLDQSYEKHIRPDESKVTNVTVVMKVHEIEKISDSNLTMTYMMHFALGWNERRLMITKNKTIWNPTAKDSITVDQKIVMYMWIPDITIYNLKEFEISQVIHRTASFRLFLNKSILYTFAARVTIGCNFHFDSYPLDTQRCNFLLGSYGHTKDEMTFEGRFLQLNKVKQRPLDYMVELADLTEEQKHFRMQSSRGGASSYSVCGLKAKLQRGYNGFILRTYFPAALFVFVSWVSYLIQPEEVVGRLALLVTLTLIEINILNGISSSELPARSTTAVEIYVLTCLIFVCMGLFEYALILYKSSSLERKRQHCCGGSKSKKEKASDDEDSDDQSDERDGSDISTEEKDKRKKTANTIDLVSGILFPSLFFIFNVVYWCYYLLKE